MRKILSLLMIMVSILSCTGCGDVSLEGASSGSVTYTYGSTSFTDALTEQELAAVTSILNGKESFSGILMGSPSCGFSREIAITVDGNVFSLALDGCATIQDQRTLGYIDLTEEEHSTLMEIFTSRGGTFPCV